MFFQHPFRQLLDTSERDALPRPQPVVGQTSGFFLLLFLTSQHQLSWSSFLDAFPLPYYLTNSTKSTERLSVRF